MARVYIVHGRYFGGKKFKAEVEYALSAPGAVSYAMANVVGARVALCSVK